MTKNKTTTTPANNPGKAVGPAEKALPSTGAENEVGEYPSLTDIKELIELVSKKEFNEFELERGGFRLYLRKGAGEPALPSSPTPANVPQPAGEHRPAEIVPAHSPAAQSAPVPQEEKLHLVASPIVGTFYRSPAP